MELLGAPSFQQQVTPIHFIVCLLFEPLEERLDQHPVSFSKPVFVLELDNFFLLVQVRFSCLKNPLRIHIFVPTGIALQGKWKNWHFLVLFHLEKNSKVGSFEDEHTGSKIQFWGKSRSSFRLEFVTFVWGGDRSAAVGQETDRDKVVAPTAELFANQYHVTLNST